MSAQPAAENRAGRIPGPTAAADGDHAAPHPPRQPRQLDRGRIDDLHVIVAARPLTELEEAILIAITGCTGLTMPDRPFTDPRNHKPIMAKPNRHGRSDSGQPR